MKLGIGGGEDLGVFITGWGAAHPPTRVTNELLVSELDTSHEWLDEHVGIVERRIAVPETVAELGASATARALSGANLDADDIDLIIGATTFDDHDAPASAARIAARLGAGAFTFDVRAACSGWLVGVEVAAAYLQTGRAERVVVCASERPMLAVDPTDRTTRPFFGDAAGAAVLETRRPARGLEVIDMLSASDNTWHDAAFREAGHWFQMDGPRIRAWAETQVAAVGGSLLGRHGIPAGDLRGLVCHQANLRLIERITAELGIPASRHWHNVEWAGNTASAGAVTALASGLDREQANLVDGDPILIVTVGSGMNAVAALTRWVC